MLPRVSHQAICVKVLPFLRQDRLFINPSSKRAFDQLTLQQTLGYIFGRCFTSEGKLIKSLNRNFKVRKEYQGLVGV